MSEALPLLFLVAVAVVAVGGVVLKHARRRAERDGLQRLVGRDPILRATHEPCGESAATLVGSPATPRGDRRYGLRYGVSGPLPVPIGEAEVAVECAAFQWWYEDRRTTTNQQGRQTRYEKRTCVAAAVRLPCSVPTEIRLTEESVLGRVGLTRGGHQVESSEFNRRFRVDGADRTLVLHLLDARMQQRLLEEFAGRSIHLRGSLLLLGGTPNHRDDSLPGVIGHLPAARQDARRLLEAVPPQFWRAVTVEREG